MTCAPEKVTGYVDAALPAAEATEIEAHLVECDTCRAQAAFERSLRTRLKELPPPVMPEGLTDRVRTGLSRSPRRRLPLWTLLPLAAAAGLAAFWLWTAPAFVAWEMARDHVHCMGGSKLDAEIWSDDPPEVNAWFTERGYAMVGLPPAAGGVELTGARRCPWPDLLHVAHVFYTAHDANMSLFVVDRSMRLGEPYRTRSKGYVVQIVPVGGVIVGLVGRDEADIDAFTRSFGTSVAHRLR